MAFSFGRPGMPILLIARLNASPQLFSVML